MTPEQLRIAIRGHLGYKRQSENSNWFDTPDGEQVHIDDMLDEINDLNAMHEVEKMLPDIANYFEHLDAICREQSEMSYSCRGVWSVSATAAQRAEAFRRTLNLCVDEQPELNQ